jgi:cytochrome c oxidase subunit 2
VRRGLIIQLLAMSAVFGAIAFLVAWFIPWLPDSAAEEADRIHVTYWVATIICLAIIAIVAAASVYAVMKFRVRDDDEEDGKPIHGHTMIEIVWTAIPTVLVIIIGVWTSVALVRNEDDKEGRLAIDVTAEQFAWSFGYPELGLERVQELHVPVGERIVLNLQANDVIHSFWVKEWSVKQDAVPGTIQNYWITPTEEGRFEIICTELCGIGHATMRNWVVVESRQEFDAWLEEQKAPPPADDGAEPEALFAQNCGSCHALAAAGTSGNVGPNLDTVLPGQSEEQVRESIAQPDAEISEGYQAGVMPSNYEDTLCAEAIDALAAYLVENAGQ